MRHTIQWDWRVSQWAAVVCAGGGCSASCLHRRRVIRVGSQHGRWKVKHHACVSCIPGAKGGLPVRAATRPRGAAAVRQRLPRCRAAVTTRVLQILNTVTVRRAACRTCAGRDAVLWQRVKARLRHPLRHLGHRRQQQKVIRHVHQQRPQLLPPAMLGAGTAAQHAARARRCMRITAATACVLVRVLCCD